LGRKNDWPNKRLSIIDKWLGLWITNSCTWRETAFYIGILDHLHEHRSLIRHTVSAEKAHRFFFLFFFPSFLSHQMGSRLKAVGAEMEEKQAKDCGIWDIVRSTAALCKPDLLPPLPPFEAQPMNSWVMKRMIIAPILLIVLPAWGDDRESDQASGEGIDAWLPNPEAEYRYQSPQPQKHQSAALATVVPW
jgi:hypothetical protein